MGIWDIIFNSVRHFIEKIKELEVREGMIMPNNAMLIIIKPHSYCFHNFRLQSCVIKQTTVQSTRS